MLLLARGNAAHGADGDHTVLRYAAKTEIEGSFVSPTDVRNDRQSDTLKIVPDDAAAVYVGLQYRQRRVPI